MTFYPYLWLRLFFVLLLPALAVGCKKEEQPAPVSKTPPVAAVPSKPVPPFDADRAFKDIQIQVDFGPRVPNTPSHAKELEYLRSQLAQYTPDVQLQNFTESGYKPGETLNLTNVIASFNPSATQRVLLLAHWDCRPHADEDPNKANHDKPVPGANDAASGTAVLLELARQFKDNPPPIGVDLLFDDGEDYGTYETDQLNRYFLGVKYFVKTKPANYNPRFAILLDMVGDKNAVFKPEGNSIQSAPSFVAEVWHTASSLGLSNFKSVQGQYISDDHLPLIEAGIPSVDLIDGDLVGHQTSDPDRKYWHTVDDLPKHLSTTTLGQVGRLLLTLIYDRLPHDIPTL